jgi:hypothetical protein
MTQYFTIICRIASHLPTHCLVMTTVLRFCSLRTSHHSRLIADTRYACVRLSFVWLACIFLPCYIPSPNQSLFAHKRLPRLQPPKNNGALPMYSALLRRGAREKQHSF